MPVKRQIASPDGVYFITFTCTHWLPLIELTQSFDVVYNWFTYLKTKGHYVAGYIIMPNHVHMLIAFRNTGQSINTIIGNGKRFMAYEIIKRLKQQNNEYLLNRLHNLVNHSDKVRNKNHEIWEDSFDWKDCRDNEFMKQKLDYMHNNPCKGKWTLAAAPVDYAHSSAKYYITGEQGIFEVLNYAALADIDLTIRLS